MFQLLEKKNAFGVSHVFRFVKVGWPDLQNSGDFGGAKVDIEPMNNKPWLCMFFFAFLQIFLVLIFEYGNCWLTRILIGSDRNPVCLTPWDHYGPNPLKSQEYGNCTGAQAPFQ